MVFSIEAMISPCGFGKRSKRNFMLSNRWRLTEAMDDNYVVTRTISGKMRLARGVRFAGEWPGGHYFKPVIIPPLEDGFVRSRVNFTAEEDGLSCTYEVVDKQVHQAAPWPATKMSATHTEAVQNGHYFTSVMRVHLEGDPACNKRLLMTRAIQIADSRLNFIAVHSGDTMIESFELTDHIGETAAFDLSVRIRRTEPGEKGLKLGVRTKHLGRELKLPALAGYAGSIENTKYDSQRSRVPKPYGYSGGSTLPDWERRPAVLSFLHCYLQNTLPRWPCHWPAIGRKPKRQGRFRVESPH